MNITQKRFTLNKSYVYSYLYLHAYTNVYIYIYIMVYKIHIYMLSVFIFLDIISNWLYLCGCWFVDKLLWYSADVSQPHIKWILSHSHFIWAEYKHLPMYTAITQHVNCHYQYWISDSHIFHTFTFKCLNYMVGHVVYVRN